MKKLFLFLCLLMAGFVQAQINCNTWMFAPAQHSYVNAGPIAVTGNQITVEALIHRTSFNSNGQFTDGDVVSKHAIFGSNVNYLLRPTYGSITVGGQLRTTIAACQINLNQTYHVAMVYNGVQLRFYRNGFLMSAVACTGNMDQNTLTTMIGYQANQGSTENFVGYIDEVRIWNVARTQAQIRAFMTTTLPNPTTQAGLLAYYRFNSLLNLQGNAAFNGSLFNGTNIPSGATINQTVPNCNFLYDSCGVISAPPVTASCSDTCYWRVDGNTIIGGRNVFGTRSNDDIQIFSNNAARGIIAANGNFGWKTTAPSTGFHIDCANPTAPSNLRFENLGLAEGTPLVVDASGYVYRQRKQVQLPAAINNCAQVNYLTRNVGQGALDCSQVYDDGMFVGINTTFPFWVNGTPSMFYVNGDAVANSLFVLSDGKYKRDVKNITNARSIIDQLRGVTYTWDKSGFPEKKFSGGTQAGFIAQEVNKVFPMAVAFDGKENYAVNYNAFIPLLAEGQQELGLIVDELLEKNRKLEQELNDLRLQISRAQGGHPFGPGENRLLQNRPNPFSSVTTIDYVVANVKSSAFVVIFDLTGKELKRYRTVASGKGSVEVQANDLVSGMYLYSLIVDGREVDTQKMVLSK